MNERLCLGGLNAFTATPRAGPGNTHGQHSGAWLGKGTFGTRQICPKHTVKPMAFPFYPVSRRREFIPRVAGRKNDACVPENQDSTRFSKTWRQHSRLRHGLTSLPRKRHTPVSARAFASSWARIRPCAPALRASPASEEAGPPDSSSAPRPCSGPCAGSRAHASRRCVR